MSYRRAANGVGESSRTQSIINSTSMHPSDTISRRSTYHGASGHLVFFEGDSGENAILEGVEEDYAPQGDPINAPRKIQMKDIGINTVLPYLQGVANKTKAPFIVNMDGGIIPVTTESKDFAKVERLSTHEWVRYNNRTRKIFINLQALDCGRKVNMAKAAEMEAIFNSKDAKTTTFQRALACLTAAEAMTPYRPKLSKFNPLGSEADSVRRFYSLWENGTYLLLQLRDSQPHRDDLQFLDCAYHVFYDLRNQWTALFRAIDAVTGPNEKKLAPPPPAAYGGAPAVFDIPGHKFMKGFRKARKAFDKGLEKALDKGKTLSEDMRKALGKGPSSKVKGKAREA